MITKLSGKKVFPIGFGTWGFGGWLFTDKSDDRIELEAIKFALDSGINVIDTAELYGKGHSEELVGRAIAGRDREELVVITKAWMTHLSRDRIMKAAKASLKRLNTDYIDLYLIHWPRPLMNMKETIGAMEELVDKGLVRSIGVSNFGVDNLKRAIEATKRYDIAADEIKYSLAEKACEKDVVPFCEKNGIDVIAYTPLAKGRISEVAGIGEIAKAYGKTPVQVALNYLARRSLPIPKSSNKDHIREMIGSVGWQLKKKDYGKLGAD